MKKTLAILSAAMLACTASAALNTFSGVTFTNLLPGVILGPTAGAGMVTTNGVPGAILGVGVVDLVQYKGTAAVDYNVTGNVTSNVFCYVAVQDSANGTTAWTNVTGTTFTFSGTNNGGFRASAQVNLDACKRYIRGWYAASNVEAIAVSATLSGYK